MTAPLPLSSASLSVPTKAVVVDAVPYAFDAGPDGSPGWTGLWIYPDKPVWSQADRLAWEQANGHKIAETARLADAVAAIEAAANSPTTLLAAVRLDVDEVTRARAAAERKAIGEVAWSNAREQHKGRCSRVDGEEGDVFVLRVMSNIEITVAEHQAEVLASKHPDNPLRQRTERHGAHLNALLATLVHPPIDRARECCASYPLLVGRLMVERDQLIKGWRDEQGKESAL